MGKPSNKKTNKANSQEETKEMPRNPMEYSYRGDEMIEIPASLFLQLYRANDAAIAKGTRREFPTALEWVSTSTGMKVINPKEQDIKEGKVTQVMSVENTFNRSNLQETFEPWLFPDIIQAKDKMIQLHAQNVEKGIATKISELEEERKAAQRKMAEEQNQEPKE